MPDLYDDDDELMDLLDSGGEAAPVTVGGDDLQALLEEAVGGDEESRFQSEIKAHPWYSEFIKKNGGPPNLDDPDYDYRAAWKAGIRPEIYKHDGTYHWASSLPDGRMLKSERHPTAWMEHFMRSTGKDPNDLGIRSEEEGVKYLDSMKGNAPSAGWTPAGEETGLESLLDDETASVPAPKDTAGLVMADQDGQQAPFGVKDQRQDLTGNASRVAELYGQLEPEPQTGPGRHEQELNASWQGSDDEIQKAMRAAAIMKALFDDDGGYGERAKYLIEREKERASRLSSARAADAAEVEKNRRVDQATAEMLVLAGVSPEAAVKARMGDPIVQLVRSTGGLGVKLRNQDTQVLNKNVGETGDVWQTLTEEKGKNERQDKQLDNNLEVAKIRKRQGKGGAGGSGGADPALLSAFLQRNENVSPQTADAFVAGTLDPSDPSFPRLSSALTIFKGMTGKKQDQLLGGTLGREGGNADKAAVSAEVKRADPVQRTKLKREIGEYNKALGAAITGWNSLPNRIKTLVATTGLEGTPAQLAKAGMTSEEQAQFSPVIALVNENIKRTAGAAVSNSEWARKSAEIGLSGALSPFNSPSVLSGWLKRAREAYQQDVSAIESEYPGLFGGGQ